MDGTQMPHGQVRTLQSCRAGNSGGAGHAGCGAGADRLRQRGDWVHGRPGGLDRLDTLQRQLLRLLKPTLAFELLHRLHPLGCMSHVQAALSIGAWRSRGCAARRARA